MNSSVLFGFPYGQLECLSCTLASLPGRSECSSHAPAYRGLTRFAERALSHPYLVGLDARVMLRRTAVLPASRNALSRILTWSVWMDSDHRPRAYQARALAT